MGGFNFPYTSLRLESQQIFWIKLIVKDPDQPWLALFTDRFGLDFYKLLKSNVNSQYVNFGSFYNNILDLWHQLRLTIKKDIFGEYVAYNPAITIGDNIISNKKIYNENVTLFELLNFTDLRAQSIKYSINELTLLGLRNKFPLPDNSRIQPNSNLFNIKLEKTKHILKITPKEVYEFRLKSISKWPSSKSKWEQKLEKTYNENYWEGFYTYTNQISDNKEEIFFFQKYAHRLIIGNEKLNKFNMKAHDRCELCNVATDTQEHIFFECDYNNNLFKSLIQWLSISLKTNLNIKYDQIVLYIFNDLKNPRIDTYNRMLWFAKFFIYKKQKEKDEICLYTFLRYIKNYINHERSKCVTDRDFSKHFIRWSLVENAV